MPMPDLTPLARDLRQQMTDAERFLWSRLRRRFLGAKFRRQVPLGPFIVDFACMRSKLVIEVDGPLPGPPPLRGRGSSRPST